MKNSEIKDLIISVSKVIDLIEKGNHLTFEKISINGTSYNFNPFLSST